MFTTNPHNWTAPSWHPDFGDAKSELDHLRTLALALQVRNCEITTMLKNPEPGYMYLRVTQGISLVAQAYWRERECDYALFVFSPRGEVEAYPKTEADATALIVSHLMKHSHLIGGKDIVIPATGTPASLDACARVVLRQWPAARFEDAERGEKYSTYGDIPLGRIRHLLAYADAAAEALWDADSPDSRVNSMLYLILGKQSVTAVLDDPNLGEMPAILEGIRLMMEMEILHTDAVRYAEAA